MTITVALDRRDLGPIAVPIEVGDPAAWTREDVRELLFTLQRLLGGGSIHAIRLQYAGLAFLVEVVGVGGRVTTPLFTVPEPVERIFQRAEFEIPNASGGK